RRSFFRFAGERQERRLADNSGALAGRGERHRGEFGGGHGQLVYRRQVRTHKRVVRREQFHEVPIVPSQVRRQTPGLLRHCDRELGRVERERTPVFYRPEQAVEPQPFGEKLVEGLTRSGIVHHPARRLLDAAEALEELGHQVDDSHPGEMDDPNLIANFIVRWTTGQDWNLKYWGGVLGRELGPEDVEPCTWALAEQGRSHTGGDLLRAIEKAQASSRRVAAWWADEGFDLLLTPTCAEPPSRLGEFEAPPDNPMAPLLRAIPFGTFTAGFNTTGQPAVSLPLHMTADGLPVGVQLVAASGREDLLLRIAAQLEEARPWADRTPPVHAESPAGRPG
ncbi:MAG: hypothetical protein JO244_05200, partial [Solirubrobacterales bacterium]|nr:hypothetical protein [Solirubrobacterales bacterium]